MIRGGRLAIEDCEFVVKFRSYVFGAMWGIPPSRRGDALAARRHVDKAVDMIRVIRPCTGRELRRLYDPGFCTVPGKAFSNMSYRR